HISSTSLQPAGPPSFTMGMGDRALRAREYACNAPSVLASTIVLQEPTPTMPRTRLASHLFTVSLALLLPHCADDGGSDPGPVQCGDTECGLHQRCDDGPSPRCVCEPE